MDRFRLIDDLIQRGKTLEVLVEYQRLTPEYEKFYVEKIGCSITQESIECNSPTDMNLLMGATIGAVDYLKYLNFFFKYDASLDNTQKSQLAAYIKSMEKVYIQLKDDFHSRTKNK